MVAEIQAKLVLVGAAQAGGAAAGGAGPGGAAEEENRRNLRDIARSTRRPGSIFGGGILGALGGGAAAAASAVVSSILGLLTVAFVSAEVAESDFGQRISDSFARTLGVIPDSIEESVLDFTQDMTRIIPSLGLIKPLLDDVFEKATENLFEVVPSGGSFLPTDLEGLKASDVIKAIDISAGTAEGSIFQGDPTRGLQDVADIRKDINDITADGIINEEELILLQNLRAGIDIQRREIVQEIAEAEVKGQFITEEQRNQKSEILDLEFEINDLINRDIVAMEKQVSVQQQLLSGLIREAQLRRAVTKSKEGDRTRRKFTEGEKLSDVSVEGREGTFTGRVENIGGQNLFVGIRNV